MRMFIKFNNPPIIWKCLVHVGLVVSPLRIVALHEAWPQKQKAYDDAAAAGDPTDSWDFLVGEPILWFCQVLLVLQKGYKKDTWNVRKLVWVWKGQDFRSVFKYIGLTSCKITSNFHELRVKVRVWRSSLFFLETFNGEGCRVSHHHRYSSPPKQLALEKMPATQEVLFIDKTQHVWLKPCSSWDILHVSTGADFCLQ